MSKEHGDGTNGNKEQVKLELHDITERMSKLLCNYEGEKECISSNTGDVKGRENGDNGFMKEGLMDVLTDFHNMANAREELLETLMKWFEGSSQMLSTADSSEDPEESWSHIENEMQRLLTTVERLQEPTKIADIERKLLGAVLKEENIERIEQIRGEYKGIGDSRMDVQEECNQKQTETETETEDKPNMGVNKLNQTKETDCIATKDTGAKECCEKEIQVNTEQIGLLKQEQTGDSQTNANNKLCYTNGSTQTKVSKDMKEFQPKYKQQTDTKQCCVLENKVNKLEIREQTTNIKRENINTNHLESIEVNINRKFNEISNETNRTEIRMIESLSSTTTTTTTTNTNTQIQQITTHISVEEEMHLDIVQESQNIKSTTTTLPRIKFQSKRQNKNRFTNAIRGFPKSGTEFKVNVKPEEWSRHEVYMHLPIATTRNRGLGLIPPINKRMIITPATERQLTDTNRGHTVPIEIQLNTTARKHREFKLEVLSKDTLFDCGQKSVINGKVAVENVEFVEFRCFSDKIRKSIGETDLIELIPEYVGRENPVLKRCRQGRGNGQFYNPRGISIDRNTNEVFIADKNNSRIQVLTAEGEYLRSFGTDHLKEPHGICVSQDGVFVTDRATECLLKFSLAGQFINKTGSRGTEPGCFSGISGLCYEAGLVYVCDVSVQRIQVINSNLQFVKEFGSGEITFPTDISIHSDTLHILSQDQNTIYCYNRDGNYLKKIELTGQEQQMTTALYFTTDKRGNFLIADKDWFLMIRNFN